MTYRYLGVAGGGTLPTGFSAVRPPTPAEVAEAEKSFQLAVRIFIASGYFRYDSWNATLQVHRQRPGQRRRAPPAERKRVAQFLPLPPNEQSLAVSAAWVVH